MRVLIPLGTLAESVKATDLAGQLSAFGAQPIICKTSQSKFAVAREIERLVLFDYSGTAYPTGVLSASRVLTEQILGAAKSSRSNLMLCVGDTTTAWSAALAASEGKLPLIHLEAGMRTNNLTAPFPEEFFRRDIDRMADLHICFHQNDAGNLASEGLFDTSSCLITRSTIYDDMSRYVNRLDKPVGDTIIVHNHRRETPSVAYFNLLKVVNDLVRLGYCSKAQALRNRRFSELAGSYRLLPNIDFIEPLAREDFLYKLFASKCVLSDSGTVQEECAALSIPHIIFRTETERPYLLNDKSFSHMIGHDVEAAASIISSTLRWSDKQRYKVRELPADLIGGSNESARFIIERGPFVTQ